MKKPSKNEVQAALALCIFLLASVTIINTISQRYIHPNSETMTPNTLSGQRDILIE